MWFVNCTLSGGSLVEAGPWVNRRPLHCPVCLTLCFQEDTRGAQRQRLQKHLAEQLRQTWGRLGSPQQTRDLGELLQAWGAGTRTSAPKGSRFTHSEKFTFHVVGGPEWTLGMLNGAKSSSESCFMYRHTTIHTGARVPSSYGLSPLGAITQRGPLAPRGLQWRKGGWVGTI